MSADRDPLNPATREEVTIAQFEISRTYWSELAKVAQDKISEALSSDALTLGPPQPIKPKQPQRVLEVLKRYAVALFDCEHSHHSLIYLRTLDDIADRTEALIKKNILDFEYGSKGRYSLIFHATIDEMLSSVRARIKEHIKTLPGPFTINLPFGSFLQPQPSSSHPATIHNLATENTRTQPPVDAIPVRILNLGEMLDEAASDQGISHEEQAVRIGISRAVYFEVKAGRGGKRSRHRARTYLSSIKSKQ